MAAKKTKKTPSGRPGQGTQNSSPVNKRVVTTTAKRKLSETKDFANDSPSKRTRSKSSSEATESPALATTAKMGSTIQAASSAASAKNGKNADAGKEEQGRNATSTTSKFQKLSSGSPECSPLSVKKGGLNSGSTRKEKRGDEPKDKVEPEPVRDWNDCSDVSDFGSNCPCDRCRGLLDTTDESDADDDDDTTDDDTVKVKSPPSDDEIIQRLPQYQNQNRNQQFPRPQNGLRRRMEPSAAATQLTDAVAQEVSADAAEVVERELYRRDLKILELQMELETTWTKLEYVTRRAEVLKGYVDDLVDRRRLNWD